MGTSRRTPIQKLRSRPLAERRILGTALYLAVAVVIVASWVSSFRTSLIPPAPSLQENVGGNGGNAAPSLSQIITPFQSLKAALETAVSDFRRAFPEGRDLAENPGAPAGPTEASPISGNPDEAASLPALPPSAPPPVAPTPKSSPPPRIADSVTRLPAGRSHFVPPLASAVAPPAAGTEPRPLLAAIGEILTNMWRMLTR